MNPAQETKSVKRSVSLGYLNLRAGPGLQDRIVAHIPAGTTGLVMKGTCVAPARIHFALSNGTACAAGYPPTDWSERPQAPG
jgi:uncharacterized protein YraI